MATVRVPYSGQQREFNILEGLKVCATGAIHTGEETKLGGEHILAKDQIAEFQRALNNVGIGLDGNNVALANNHAGLNRITGRASGYKKMLWRHKDCIDRSKPVTFVDKTRRCTVIAGIIEDAEIPF